MGFKAKDGKSFGNRQQMSAYDDREPKNGSEKVHHNQAGGGDEGQDESPQDIHEMVAQHGPAEKIEMQHDHAAGKHTVVSHHGGKKHHSEHASAQEAHQHAMTASGVEPQQEEQPAMAGGAMQGAGAIPGM